MAREARNLRELRAQRGRQRNAAVGPDGEAGLAQQEAWPRKVEARQQKPDTGLTVFGNCLMILLQSIVVLLGIGFCLGSMLMVGVLKEIRQRDFSGPMARIKSYEDYIGGMRKAGCSVVKDNPRITTAGITTYLWTVEPKGRDDLCRFQWQHVIQDNAIIPQTNGALLLDIRLGNITQAEAAKYSFYNPNDQIALGLLAATPSAPGAVATTGKPPAETSVLPPLISPADAKGRARHGEPKEEETAPATGDGAVGDGAGDGTEPPRVEPPGAPPDGGGDGDGGGGTEPPRVEPPVKPPEGGGGGETPPSGDGAGY
jgi:hypothetical protein